MSTCLIIDTSNRWLIVGLSGLVSAEEVQPAERRASTKLISTIRDLLSRGGLRRPDWILCLRGPGSFTGARIGVSTARSLAQLWGVPVLGLDSTAAYAYSCLLLNEEVDEVCVQIDGKQRRVYARRVLRTSAIETIRTEPPLDIAPSEALAKYPHAIHFVDDVEAIVGYLGDKRRYPLVPMVPPAPAHFAALASLVGGEAIAADYGALVPLYLRDDPAHTKHPEGFQPQGG